MDLSSMRTQPTDIVLIQVKTSIRLVDGPSPEARQKVEAVPDKVDILEIQQFQLPMSQLLDFVCVRPDVRSNAVGSEAVEPEVLTPEQAEARRHAKSSVEVQAGVDENLIEGANAPHNPDADDGLAQPNPVDAQAVVEIADAPVWTKFDLGTSLQLLRSTRPGVVRRALRKLHVRWYHAPSRRMATFLTAAGVSSGIVALVPDIVSTCEICRAWSRPGPRSMTSTRLPEKFNLEVEIDLLFVGTQVVLHMVDRCIRWTVAVELANRTTDEILSGIREGWVSRFGAPTVLISDEEGGLNEYAGAIL